MSLLDYYASLDYYYYLIHMLWKGLIYQHYTLKQERRQPKLREQERQQPKLREQERREQERREQERREQERREQERRQPNNINHFRIHLQF